MTFANAASTPVPCGQGWFYLACQGWGLRSSACTNPGGTAQIFAPSRESALSKYRASTLRDIPSQRLGTFSAIGSGARWITGAGVVPQAGGKVTLGRALCLNSRSPFTQHVRGQN